MEKEAGFLQKKIPMPMTAGVTKVRKPPAAAAAVSSVTRDEIEQYWRMKKMIEEDHLLAAQKAAARIRAKSLKEEDYRRFEESLKAMIEEEEEKKKDHQESLQRYSMDGEKELRIGIKDWWTKSKYAYLNQPAVKSMAMGPEVPAAPAPAAAAGGGGGGGATKRKRPATNKYCSTSYIPQLAFALPFLSF